VTTPIDLPAAPSRRLAVRVTPDALRQLRGGHPWVFESSIRSAPHDGVAGQLAVVFDDQRRFTAIGLWDPTSPIRLRVLHTGAPRTIDDAFWRDRVVAALGRRSSLLADPATTGVRLVHGENDALPGLVIDAYGSTAVAKVYTPAWFPHLHAVLGALADAAAGVGRPVDRVVLRCSRNVRPFAPAGVAQGSVLVGTTPDGPVEFLENGLTFEADVLTGQKTGYFLDQRDNRAAVRRLARDASVLDVFACTGGFSVHAADGGATEVTSVDLSRRSLATAQANWRHNTGRPDVATSRHHLLDGDAFDVMADLGRRRRRFDLVVVDPPSFAHRGRDAARAVEAYGRLAELGLALVAPGGRYVQSSCSSRVDADELRSAVLAAAPRSGREVRVRDVTGHAVDHPIGFAHGAYLKTVFLDVR